MKAYKKHHNSGPVPHPDQSGKYLQDGEVVYGDEWEPLVALDYVVAVESDAPVAEAPKVAEPVVAAPVAMPEPVVVPEPEPVQQSAVSEAEMGDSQEDPPLVSDDPTVAQKGRRRKTSPSNV